MQSTCGPIKPCGNQTANVYNAEGFDKLLSVIGQPEFTTFDEVERRVFSKISLENKDVAQLGCNNGRELISVKKAGAGRCVGFDLSENFIALARQLALESGSRARVRPHKHLRHKRGVHKHPLTLFTLPWASSVGCPTCPVFSK